jgi:hypothetical protein
MADICHEPRYFELLFPAYFVALVGNDTCTVL